MTKLRAAIEPHVPLVDHEGTTDTRRRTGPTVTDASAVSSMLVALSPLLIPTLVSVMHVVFKLRQNRRAVQTSTPPESPPHSPPLGTRKEQS